MKEIWTYIKWQHKISKNSISLFLIYTTLGTLLKTSDKKNIEIILIIMISFLIIFLNFPTLWAKELKNEEKLFPIKKSKKIISRLLYFSITLVGGIIIAYASRNILIQFLLLISGLIYMWKNDFFNEKTIENLDLRKLLKRR